MHAPAALTTASENDTMQISKKDHYRHGQNRAMLHAARLGRSSNDPADHRRVHDLSTGYSASICGPATIKAQFRGRLSLFSIERLMHFLTRLNQELILTIRPARRGHKPGLSVLVAD